MNHSSDSNWSTIKRCVRLLSRRDRRKVALVVVFQVVMGGLDLLAIALIGVLGSLAVSGVSSRQPGNRVGDALELLGLQGQSFQFQASVLGIGAAVLLTSRTVISVITTRRILYFLSYRAALVSSSLIARLLSQPLLFIQRKTSQETLYAVTTGVSSITLGVIGTSVAVVSDFSLMLVMGVGLIIVDPIVALGSLIVFGSIAIFLYQLMNKRALGLGAAQMKYEVKSNEKIIEVLNSYRESVVRGRRSYYSSEIGELRKQLASTQAELTFMPSISKYVIEATIVIGAVTLSAIQFVLQDAVHAVATLSIFMAAGTRIAPAALRLQQGALQIKSSLGITRPTLELIESMGETETENKLAGEIDYDHDGFISEVETKAIQFTYPEKSVPAVNGISLKVRAGESVALVGSSGAGKTTLVDLLLGVLSPDSGEVKISGVNPSEAIQRWPGAISYVPQDVVIANGSVIENVALGYDVGSVDVDRVWNALRIAELEELVKGMPDGLKTQVGERGAKLSGGQRQRLGIARAMLTNPKLLILDEATSALDGQIEADISKSISNMKGQVTVILVAHRLSTVRSCDKIIYLEAGISRVSGTFDEVRNTVSDFDKQASLMGL